MKDLFDPKESPWVPSSCCWTSARRQRRRTDRKQAQNGHPGRQCRWTEIVTSPATAAEHGPSLKSRPWVRAQWLYGY